MFGPLGFWTMAPLRCAAPWRNPRKERDHILPSGNLEYRVCDNVDLGLVLADFVNFYHVR